MYKVIITGASGFVGRWLVREMVKNHVHVTAIVRDKTKMRNILREFSFAEYDCISGQKVVREEMGRGVKIVSFSECDQIENKGYDAFYDLAWDGVDNREKNNLNKQLGNIKRSIQLLYLSRKLDCKVFIGIGTVAEYAFSENIINMAMKQTPGDIYGAAKTANHYFLDVIAKQIEQPFIWAMLPSVFGEERESDNILTYTIKTLLRGEVPSYGKLEQIWDFLYIEDCVRALRFLGESGHIGKEYGIGSGRFLPLREYIYVIRDMINHDLKLNVGERDELTAKSFSSCVNNIDLIRDTGFRPQITFEEGIKKTIEYYRRKVEDESCY